MNIVDNKSIGIIGRKQNAVLANYNKSITITTDILKKDDAVNITLDDALDRIDLFAQDYLIETRGANRDPESMVYGESLVNLLRWIITTLMTHKHPPNAPPIGDFFPEANSRSKNMDVDILNKNIKTK